ncbi:MAG: type II secretion system protein [Desulfobulbus sp.]|nr:type II secretion system protein [Desulfobulbus sp.]
MVVYRADNGGFTLLELIVVMALIALTASFSIPQLGGFLAADQMKTTVRRLVGLVHQTADLARREQIPYLLTYESEEHRFVAAPEGDREKSPLAAEDKTLSLPVPETVFIGELWSWFGGNQSREERTIRFSKQGYIEPTILYLARDDGREMSLILSPFLGSVRVMDNHVVPDTTLFAQ